MDFSMLQFTLEGLFYLKADFIRMVLMIVYRPPQTIKMTFKSNFIYISVLIYVLWSCTKSRDEFFPLNGDGSVNWTKWFSGYDSGRKAKFNQYGLC